MSSPNGRDEESDDMPVPDNHFWEKVWNQGVAPGQYWDMNGPLPELIKQVQSLKLPRGGRALIPGCGRGYDVELLSRCGFYEHVIGIDVSRSAVCTAKKYLSSVLPPLPSNWDVFNADFLHDDILQASLVYDYSFFSVLAPELRVDWGRRMAQVVGKGGSLVTVMFPVEKFEGGPPFAVSKEDYDKALGRSFKIVDGPTQLDESQSHMEGTWWCRWLRV